MASEARIYKQLLAVIGLVELEEKYARREIIDVCDSKGDNRFGELVSDDLYYSQRGAVGYV